MDAPTPETVRAALADFDPCHQKIAMGMLAVMIREPARVRDREWMAQRLAEIALLAGDFEAGSPQEGVTAVQDFLRAHSPVLLEASFLLFQRVGLDLAPRVAAGFSLEEALQYGLEYLPPPADGTGADEATEG